MAQKLGVFWVVLFVFKNKNVEKTSGQDLYIQSSKAVESEPMQSVSSVGLAEVQAAEQLRGDAT